MAKKFTSLNNFLCRRIVGYASNDAPVECYTLLFNSRTQMEESLFIYLFDFVFELRPITYREFKKLHPQIQTYFNNYYIKHYGERTIDPRIDSQRTL